MKKNSKKLLLLLLTSTMSIGLLTGCNKNEGNEVTLFEGVKDTGEEDNEDPEKTKEQQEKEKKDKEKQLEDEKKAEAEADNDTVNFSRVESIYVDQLDDRTRQAYMELKNAAEKGLDSIELKTVITQKDLNRIFNILLLDTPEVVGLSNNYSYEMDSSKNVVKVNFKYFLTKAKMESLQRARIKAIKAEQDLHQDEETLKSEIIEKLIDNPLQYKESVDGLEATFDVGEIVEQGRDHEDGKIIYKKINDKSLQPLIEEYINKLNGLPANSENKTARIKGIDYNAAPAVINSQVGDKNNTLGQLKGRIDLLRSLGFRTSIAAGEFISDDIKPEKQPYDSFKFIEANKLYKAVKSDNIVEVNSNPFNYYFWLLVEVEDEFFVYDPMMEKTLSYYGKAKLQRGREEFDQAFASYHSSDSVFENSMYKLVPDNFIAGTRIMYHNEELLGLSPASSSMRFSSLRGSDKFIEKTGMSNLKHASNEFIDEIITSSKTDDVVYRVFPNEDALKDFAKFFREDFDKENAESKNAVKEYKTKELNSCNMFIVYDILK